MPEPSSFDLQALLKRSEEQALLLEEMKELLAAKDQLIAYLQQQLHDSKSERYDPAQEHLDFDESLLGKPEPSAPETSGPEDDAEKRKKTKRKRRTKDQLFPRWIKSVVVEELIPDEVSTGASPASPSSPSKATSKRSPSPILRPSPAFPAPFARPCSSARSSVTNFATTSRTIARASASNVVMVSNSSVAPS